MKPQTIIDLANKALEENDINTANDLILIIKKNFDKFPNKSFTNTLIGSLENLVKGQIAGRKIGRDDSLIIYDFSKFDSHKISWFKLWDKDKYPTFTKFFINYLLPTFHKVPHQDIQHPIMACFALFNCASIPNDGKKANAICTGQSRTGKSKFAERVMQLLPKSNTCTIKGNSSPKAITEKIHTTCYVDGDENNLIVRPSVTRFDNIYWDDFIRRLDIHYVTLLALEKSDAICEIAGKEGGKFHTFSKYVFTTVEQPVRDTPRMDELLNRSFCFYFEKGFEPDVEPTLYRWEGFAEEYLKVWNKYETEQTFFKILSDVMAVNVKDTVMSLEYLEISRVMIATGLYCGVFETIQQALTAFENYWQFATVKQDNVGNLLYKLVTNYLQSYYYDDIDFHQKISKGKNIPDVRISVQHLSETLSSVSNGVIRMNQKLMGEVENIMNQHDLTLVQKDFGLEFAKKSFLRDN